MNKPIRNNSFSARFSLLDYIATGCCIIDESEKVIFWNSILETYTGIEREHILGSKIDCLFPAFSNPLLKNRLKIAFEKGLPVTLSSQLHECLFVAKGKNCGNVKQNISMFPVFEQDDSVNYLAITVNDVSDLSRRIVEKKVEIDEAKSEITQRKKFGDDLAKMNRDLEERVKLRTLELEEAHHNLEILLEKERVIGLLKSEIISTISHEYRTPLTEILSSAEIIKVALSKGRDIKYDRFFDKIFSSVQSMTELLDKTLEVNPSDIHKIRVNRELLDFVDLANIFASEIKANSGRRLEIKNNSTTTKVCTDIHLLKNIMKNLLTNAQIYSPQEKPIIITFNMPDNSFIFSITDFGDGISAGELEKIFEPFYRSSKYIGLQRGIGLGLSISKRYVDALGGIIEVESKPGDGSTFIVKIPILNN